MKNKNILYNQLVNALLLLAIVSFTSMVTGQDPINTRMKMTATQIGDSVMMEGLVRAKIDDRYTGLKGLEVSYYTYDEEDENDLGTAITNADGIATFTVRKSDILIDSTGLFTVGVMFEGNDQYEDSDDEVELIDAKMEIEAFEDTDDEGNVERSIEITLTSLGEPVSDVSVFLYKKSMLRPLMIGEEITDEDGMATFDFPIDLPGSKDGELHIYSYVEDDLDHGNMKAGITKTWAPIRVEAPGITSIRSLSSPNPPLWLLITFLGALVIILGHYAEVVYKLFKLKKLN